MNDPPLIALIDDDRAWAESLAEYLALRSVRRFLGDSAFRERLFPYAQHWIRDSTSVPLDSIARADQFHERYQYEYVPALLVGLEDLVGTDAVDRFLSALLREPDWSWTYASVRAAAVRSGIPRASWDRFESDCLRARRRSSCLRKYVS